MVDLTYWIPNQFNRGISKNTTMRVMAIGECDYVKCDDESVLTVPSEDAVKNSLKVLLAIHIVLGSQR